MTSATRYFIPVCFYPYTKYRTSVGAAALFNKYQLCAHDYLIVVADRLLVLDRLVTGRYWTVNSAVSKARQEAKQVVSLMTGIAHKAGAHEQGKILYWDDIAETAEFSEFALQLQKKVLSDELLASSIKEFVERRVKRFGVRSDHERENGYKLDYLLSEVSMSVYCTEILGFSNEVWERPPAADVPDPLKLLYGHRRELVAGLTGRPVRRALHFLYADAHDPAGHIKDKALSQA